MFAELSFSSLKDDAAGSDDINLYKPVPANEALQRGEIDIGPA